MSASTLYTVMTGLEAATYRQALQANNLANVDTPGFRAQMGSLVSTPFKGPAPDAGMADVVTENAGYSHRQGAIKRTGSPWNVALNGKGWLVTKSASGQIALTRDGRLHRGRGGLLRDSHNDIVLGANKQPISLPKLKHLEIGADGAISGVPAGQGTDQAQQFNRLYVAQTPSTGMQRIGDSRFSGPNSANALKAATSVHIRQGYLNGSDVNGVKAMTELINDTRSFQIETRLERGSETASKGLDTLIRGA